VNKAMLLSYPVTPVPKPRQTQSDRWKQRPCVERYRAFADQCRAMCLPVFDGAHIRFVLPMPKSWSKKKRREMLGQPHRQRPDLDNLLKALMDATNKEDCALACLGSIQKVWGEEGRIDVG